MGDMNAICPDLVPTERPAPLRVHLSRRAPRSAEGRHLDRRAQVRVPYETEVVVYGEGMSCTGLVRNVSERGVSIETHRPMPPLARVELQLPLLDVTLQVRGEVRWSRPPGGIEAPGFGVYFHDLREDQQAALRAFLDRLVDPR